MTIEDPCTHPAEWACKGSPDDPTRCVGQAKWEAWIVAEEEMKTARAKGNKLYINMSEKPDLVGDVDMTADAHKQPLDATGDSEVVQLPDDLQHLNDNLPPNEEAVEFWRNAQRRAPKDAQ
jgi:hypothetical protein